MVIDQWVSIGTHIHTIWEFLCGAGESGVFYLYDHLEPPLGPSRYMQQTPGLYTLT